MSKPSRFRLLHLSDVHFGAPDTKMEQSHITQAIYETVERNGIRPDAILFSGDLAHSGVENQFEQGFDWLSKISEYCSRPPLFVIPGNHDVHQTDTQPHFFRQAAKESRVYDEWQATSPRFKQLDTFFKASRKRETSLNIKSSWKTPYGGYFKIDEFIAPISFIYLNSAILSCDNNDEGNLVVDIATVNSLLDTAKQANGLTIVTMHHPLAWLVEWNRDELSTIISQQNRGAHLLLHGHLHEQYGRAQANFVGAQLTTLSTGASYQDARWEKYFSLYEIDLSESEVQAKTFMYSREADMWIDVPMYAVNAIRIKKVNIPNAPVQAEIIEPAPAQPNDAASAHPQIDAHIAAATELLQDLESYFSTNSSIDDMCHNFRSRVKTKNSILDKIDRHQKSDPGYDIYKLGDVLGVRIVTLYQSDIPIVLKSIFDSMSLNKDHFFFSSKPLSVDINTSRPPVDPLSITQYIQDVVTASGLFDAKDIEIRPRQTGYSSIHIVVSLAPKYERQHVKCVNAEIQIRSSFEDAWGEIDHSLRYGDDRGSVGTTSGKHLNALKSLIDGIIQYADVIKEQSHAERLYSPLNAKTARSIGTPAEQIEKLRQLHIPNEMLGHVHRAFDLWEKADASRGLGGLPGSFRKAADEFLSIIQMYCLPQPQAYDSSLIDELEYICNAERAYMLLFTGSVDEIVTSIEIYEKTLQKRPNDASTKFRLGSALVIEADHRYFVLGEPGYTSVKIDAAISYLDDAIQHIEAGLDTRLNTDHWAYDRARTEKARANWIKFYFELDHDTRLGHLRTAIDICLKVVKHHSTNESYVDHLNDYLYYICELRAFGYSNEVNVLDFNQYSEDFFNLVMRHRSDLYTHLDTLARVFDLQSNGQKVSAAANVLLSVLEEIARKKNNGREFSTEKNNQWASQVGDFLNRDERDSLAFARDMLTKYKTR